jgi:hypothetical protein
MGCRVKEADVSSKSNRKQQRAARTLAAQQSISYQAALRQMVQPDLNAAREVLEIFEQADLDLVDVFAGEVSLSDKTLADLAGLGFDDAIRHANQHGLGLLRRVARLCELEPPVVVMPPGYPAELVKDAWGYANSLGGDPDWPDVEAPRHAAEMFYDDPPRVIGASVLRWLAADHPRRLATLARVEWRGEPADLPGEGSGRELLEELDAIASSGMLDVEALQAVGEVVVRVLIVEPNA